MAPVLRTSAAIALLLAVSAAPAMAQAAGSSSGTGTERDEKLPAQLPSVTIQGEDLSTQGRTGTGRVVPTGSAAGSGVRLPDPGQRRATSEDNRALMVGVTPTTVEVPAALPPTRLPYTSVLGGWGPITQYRAGLYDARLWGPALGVTELDGRGGWGWSGWRAKEWIDWTGVGRLGLTGNGFLWEAPAPAAPAGTVSGGQNLFGLDLEYGESAELTAAAAYRRGTASANALPSLFTDRTSASVAWRPQVGPEHAPGIDATAQTRTWGKQAGAEGYVRGSNTWSLSDQIQLAGSLGGGYWGREAILDPAASFHYRPASASHLYAGLKTASELPDFEQLYLRRPATAPNDDLQSERVEGWAQLGASQRLNDMVWGRVSADLRRSWRHIYWADLDADGLWAPANAAGEQWTPIGEGRLQVQWLPNLQQDAHYRFTGVYPLGSTEHRVGTTLEGDFGGPGNPPIGVAIGAEARVANLSGLQVTGGAGATGVFAEADLRYGLTPDLTLSLSAADVPLALLQPGAKNYFAPAPLLTLNAQYTF